MRRIREWRPDAAIVLIVAAALSLPWLQEWGRRALLHPQCGSDEEWLVALSAEGDVRAIADLLSQGAPPSVHARGGVTPLIAAAYAGNTRAVAMLLENGANPNGADFCGNTPLIYAASGNRVEVIRLLLAHRADPSLRNRCGRSALDQARECAADQAAKLLRISERKGPEAIDYSRK
jgi:ankyrin repeat protein